MRTNTVARNGTNSVANYKGGLNFPAPAHAPRLLAGSSPVGSALPHPMRLAAPHEASFSSGSIPVAFGHRK
jgi:hypothetical protein